MESVVLVLFLFIASVWYNKKRGIPTKYLFLGAVVGIVYLAFLSVWKNEIGFWLDVFMGAIPGIICVFISFISREQMGFGDSFIVLFIGILTGYKRVLISFMFALLLLNLFAMFILIIKKGNRKTKIPFIPFLLAGYIGTFICI